MPNSLRRSPALGTYAPNRFLITLGPEFALVNLPDLSPRRLDDDQLSVFFHEYVHYIQNVATPAGYHGFRRALDLWWLFRETVTSDGISEGSDALAPERRKWVAQYLAIADQFDGQLVPDWTDGFAPDTFEIEEVEVSSKDLPIGTGTSRLTSLTLLGTATNVAGETGTFSYQLGEIGITEGIAYELDQIVAAGESGDHIPVYGAPPFPYQVLRKFCERECPGLDALGAVRLGCLSLLSNDPAGALVDLCAIYSQEISTAASPSALLKDIHRRSTEILSLTDAVIATDISDHEAAFQNAGSIGRSVAFLHDLFRQSLLRRKSNPFLELSALGPDGNVDRAQLHNLLASILPCTVLQQRIGSKHVIGRDILLDFHNQAPTLSDDLAVLHCAQDFLFAHLGTNSVTPTHAAGPSMCPFYSCCNLEMRREAPTNCKKRPWRAATWTGWSGDQCWYGVAVRLSMQ
jgi:hypothetical protein